MRAAYPVLQLPQGSREEKLAKYKATPWWAFRSFNSVASLVHKG